MAMDQSMELNVFFSKKKQDVFVRNACPNKGQVFENVTLTFELDIDR